MLQIPLVVTLLLVHSFAHRIERLEASMEHQDTGDAATPWWLKKKTWKLLKGNETVNEVDKKGPARKHVHSARCGKVMVFFNVFLV